MHCNGFCIALIAVEKTYIVWAVHCTVRKTAISCVSVCVCGIHWEIIITISFNSRVLFHSLCVGHCAHWMKHVGTKHTYIFLKHFIKWHVLCITLLCKSVCSKRHHGKWKELNLCTIHMVFPFNRIQCTSF